MWLLIFFIWLLLRGLMLCVITSHSFLVTIGFFVEVFDSIIENFGDFLHRLYLSGERTVAGEPMWIMDHWKIVVMHRRKV